MSSADTQSPAADADPTTATESSIEPAGPRDDLRQGLLELVTAELGDAVVGSHIRPDNDLWIRVTRDAWTTVADVAQRKLSCQFFDFLSAIDWMPSPFGRDMDSQEDIEVHGAKESKPPEPMVSGYAGGDTRFQVFARVASSTKHYGVTFKVDLPDHDLTLATWTPHFAGANWHEREVREMYGIEFIGHPNPINLYLPGAFEGYPLRKDFPLLARRAKPWPGIVDVEPMPGEPEGDGEAEAGGEST